MSTKTILGALALAAVASAAEWRLAETYDKTNFFDKFDFFTGADPTFGHVNYRTRADATEMGLIGVDGDDVFMKPETSSVAGEEGRSSVRIESKAEYDYGLFIARFAKVPTPTCGVWAAFWTYGEPWVDVGEVDIMEQWNDNPQNAPAFHTGRSDEFGVCTVDQADMHGTVLTSDCDNYYNNPPEQFEYQGCTASDDSGPWGSEEAGVYAMEWTTDFLKLYSFSGANVPTNIDSETPDTSSWGKPTMMLRNDLCDIDGHFARQKLVFNINFCGNPGGEEHGWKVESECAAKTGYETCAEYVGSEPGAFVDAFYKIRDIRVFEQGTGGGEGSEEASAEPAREIEPTGEAEPSAQPTESEETQPSAEPTVCDSYECEDGVLESETPAPVESESPQTSEPACEGESCPEEPAATTEGGSPETSEDCESSTIQTESPQATEPACEGGECAQEPAVTTEASSPEATENCEETPVPEPEMPAPVESESPPVPEHEGEEVPEVVAPCEGYECEGEHVPEPEVPAPEHGEPVAGCTGPECHVPEHPVEEEPVVHEPVPQEPAPDCTGSGCEGYVEQPEEHVPAPEESSSPVVEEPVVDEPAHEIPVDEEPTAEEPVAEPSIPAGDDGSYGEEPVEEPVGEVPVGEEPAPCVGPECEPGTSTDIPGAVPTGPIQVIGAGAKGSVSILAALIALFAL